MSGNSRLLGKVTGADGKRPVTGATIHAYHLSSEQLYVSDPTGANGRFEIPSLPLGYYDLAVVSGDGLYVGNQVVNVPPAGKAIVNFTIAPFGARPGTGEAREFPGTDRSTSGVARVTERLTGRQFWRSPKGVAVLAGGGGAVLLAIASGSNDERRASPF